MVRLNLIRNIGKGWEQSRTHEGHFGGPATIQEDGNVEDRKNVELTTFATQHQRTAVKRLVYKHHGIVTTHLFSRSSERLLVIKDT